MSRNTNQNRFGNNFRAITEIYTADFWSYVKFEIKLKHKNQIKNKNQIKHTIILEKKIVARFFAVNLLKIFWIKPLKFSKGAKAGYVATECSKGLWMKGNC